MMMNKNNIVNIFMIGVCLAVIGWAIFLISDHFRVIKNDEQRIAMVQKLQQGLEKYYQENHYYPGTPYLDGSKQIALANWNYLVSVWGLRGEGLEITSSEVRNYYDFSNFKDPCEPDKVVNILGAVKCPFVIVRYDYFGIECALGQVGCKGYKITLDSENKGLLIFMSPSLNR
jgi:hypothetical protein